MATISTVKEVVMLCGKAGVTPFIWGHRGMGKSSLVRQLAAENMMGFIDQRCSQMEASDIRGLPHAGKDGRTHYLPPAGMPIGDMTDQQIANELAEVLRISSEGKTIDQISTEITTVLETASLQTQALYYNRLKELQPHFERGILFLDEVNRAQDDVLQAIFELVLDKCVGQYVIPPGWIVVAAGNFMEGYMVNGFTDPAFINRFCHVTLSGGESTLEEWVQYMSCEHGDHAHKIIEFASHNVEHLDGKIEGELGFTIQPSRRSWEMVTKISAAWDRGGFSQIAKKECFSGLIGRELAISFEQHSCPVKPADLIKNGVKHYSRTLSSLQRNQLTGVMWGLVGHTKSRIDEDSIANTCLDFAEFMAKNVNDKDIVVAFCRALVTVGGNGNKAKAAVISNPKLATMLSKLNKKTGGKKTFIDRLADRPALQQILSKVSWGKDIDESEV